jgi:hypothetical protein
MAFVILTHLAADRDSYLAEILARPPICPYRSRPTTRRSRSIASMCLRIPGAGGGKCWIVS